MLKGDIGLKSIFAIVLSLMVLSLLISVSSVGSLGGALLQGFDEVGQFTDRTVEIEDRKTLSDLTLFVEHRAMNEGCEIVSAINDGEGNDPRPNTADGYPGLEGSFLGRYPDCFGGESSIIRDSPTTIGSPDQNYMTGVFSREQFEVTENTNISFNSANSGGDEVWLDGNVGGFYDSTLESLDGEMEVPDDDGEGWDPSVGEIVVASATGPFGASYVAYKIVDATIVDGLTSTPRAPVTVVFQDSSVDITDRTNSDDFSDLPDNPDDGDLDELDYLIWFCEGDKGYVQSNRGTVANSDGASSMEPLFPVIVVEESEHSNCGDLDLDRSDKIPDNTATSGRVLHITGRTDEAHPYVRGPAFGGSDRNYAFDFHQLNENQPELFNLVSSSGRNIEINYNSDRSDECVIGMWDHRSSAVDAAGHITLERGAYIEQDGTFPQRSSSIIGVDSLEDRSDRSVPPYPNTKALYDTYASEGFIGGHWDNSGDVLSVNDKILYDYAGERRFELYGDLLCAPHSNNNGFEDDHSEWKMCSHDQDDVTFNGDTWSCDPSSGEWDGETGDSCPAGQFECGNGQCVDDPEDCSGGF